MDGSFRRFGLMPGASRTLPAYIENVGIDVWPVNGCPSQLLHPLDAEMVFVQKIEHLPM